MRNEQAVPPKSAEGATSSSQILNCGSQAHCRAASAVPDVKTTSLALMGLVFNKTFGLMEEKAGEISSLVTASHHHHHTQNNQKKERARGWH